jgi:nucleoside-diphosphate-sugar epimerase
MNPSFWHGKRVLLTGHTGFKGSWLSLWLQSMGAQLVGYALAPPTNPSLFEIADIAQGMTSVIGDIRDLAKLQTVFAEHRPEIVIHMAAQPLVRYSYQNPVETYATNVMGTVHFLVLRQLSTSPPTSATKTASGFGAIVRTSPWAALTLTATAKVAPNSPVPHTDPLFSTPTRTPNMALPPPQCVPAMSLAEEIGRKTG